MSKELQALIRSLPVRGIQEVTSGSLVYSGVGMVSTGVVAYPVQVRVAISEGGMQASVTSEQAGLDVQGPFGSPEEREAFSRAAAETLSSKISSLRS